MKKILVVYGGAKNKGGIYTYLLELFTQLNKSKSFTLDLASIGEWPLSQELRRNGVKVIVFKKSLKGLSAGAKALRDYDLVVTMGLVSNFFGRIWGLRNRIPVLTVVHSDWRTDYENDLFKKISYFVSDRVLRFATKKYVCVSKYLEKTLISEGIDSGRIEVVYNGVNLNVVANDQCSSKSRVIIGTIGRLHIVKNYDNLIKAFSVLCVDRDITLEIAGEGGERKHLERLILELKLDGKVKLLGQQENIKECFSRWSVYVQPSLSEGFGLAVVEAMASGLPVAVSPRGALTELVKSGETGVVMRGTTSQDIKEAINLLVSDKIFSSQCAKSGQILVREMFNVRSWAQKMEKIFVENLK